MGSHRTVSGSFNLSIIALVLALVSLTVFLLIDDVLYYLLFEKIFEIKLEPLSKWILALVFILCNFGLAVAVMKAMVRQPTTGSEGMIGVHGVAMETIEAVKIGWVRVHGELWKVASDERIAKGEHVEVVGLDGLRLRVKLHKQL